MSNSNNLKITVIIVFLNEGNEVENTIKSIREYSPEEQVDILLIDDASDDGFDYRAIAHKYKTRYYKNKYRRGVALSRLDGVNLCMTEFFILLDAHMRVYDSNWASILIASLKENPRCVFCCQTIPLTPSGILEKDFSYNYGAYIDFDDFSVKWNQVDLNDNFDIYL